MNLKNNYIRIRLSTEAKKNLKQSAIDQNTSMSEIVRKRLRDV